MFDELSGVYIEILEQAKSNMVDRPSRCDLREIFSELIESELFEQRFMKWRTPYCLKFGIQKRKSSLRILIALISEEIHDESKRQAEAIFESLSKIWGLMKI